MCTYQLLKDAEELLDWVAETFGNGKRIISKEDFKVCFFAYLDLDGFESFRYEIRRGYNLMMQIKENDYLIRLEALTGTIYG